MNVLIARDGDARVRVSVLDIFELQQLRVSIDGLDRETASAALERAGLGVVSDDHAWLNIASLRASGRSLAWRAEFAAMIDFARIRGWLSRDGSQVRAHIELS